MDVADDVDPVIGAWRDMDVAGTRGDGDGGRCSHRQGALEGALSCKRRGCDGEGGGCENRSDVHRVSLLCCKSNLFALPLLLEDDSVAGLEACEDFGLCAVGDAGLDVY